ncbi:hypothetical protein HU735_17585 [Pseudomonas sp. BW16M2]|nr:hypothetical protein [Pseudomonas sp. BW16M2]
MPKFLCRCGYVMNLSQGWSDHEMTLMPESVIERVAERLEVGPMSSEQFYEAIEVTAMTVYRCPQCKRLYLEEGKNSFTAYAVEQAGA